MISVKLIPSAMKKNLLILGVLLFLGFTSCGSDDDSENPLPMEMDFTGRVISCGDFFVNQLLSPGEVNIALEIKGSGREMLGLTSEFTSFSLPHNDLEVSISEWDGPAGEVFCNDVITEGPNRINAWTAVSGNLRIQVSNIEETEFETLYTITLELENVVFENSNGEQRIIPELFIEEAAVGWLPG